ncbi:MAG TPA: hypothetical protein PKO33_15705, partial [Pyrinomonadaceae bacterium]|nr:hypothetical protein [Pyrinomonadaceae bacterium]
GKNFGEIFSELKSKLNVIAIGLCKFDKDGRRQLHKLPADDMNPLSINRTPQTADPTGLIVLRKCRATDDRKTFHQKDGFTYRTRLIWGLEYVVLPNIGSITNK